MIDPWGEDLIGNVVGGWLLAKSASTADRYLAENSGDANFNRGKILSARYFADTYLAACGSLTARIMSGGSAVVEIESAHFGKFN